MTDVVPFLGYEDCAAAADWLVRAFSFEEVERFEEEARVTHVTLRAGDGLVFLGHPGGYVNPLHLREQSEVAARMYDVPWIVDGVWIAAEDLDALVEQARAAGARILTEPYDTPHGRHCRLEDPEGHRWMLASRG
ncbi:MAG: VOC family protein [Gaiellaceae bacterium]